MQKIDKNYTSELDQFLGDLYKQFPPSKEQQNQIARQRKIFQKRDQPIEEAAPELWEEF